MASLISSVFKKSNTVQEPVEVAAEKGTPTVDNAADAAPVTVTATSTPAAHVVLDGAPKQSVWEGIRYTSIIDGDRGTPTFTRSGPALASGRVLPHSVAEYYTTWREGRQVVARDELYSPSYYAAPAYRAGTIVESAHLAQPIRFSGTPVFSAASGPIRVSSPVRAPQSYSLPVVSDVSLVSSRYSPRYSLSEGPTVFTARAIQTTADRVISSAAATAAQSGFVRIGNEYFPNDNYHVPVGRHYAQIERTEAPRTVVSEPSTASSPQYNLRPVAKNSETSLTLSSNTYVEAPREPVKMRHTSRSDYAHFRGSLPPMVITAQ